jgi:hypothetical protein
MKLTSFDLAFVETSDFAFGASAFSETGLPVRSSLEKDFYPQAARIRLHATSAAGADDLDLYLSKNENLFHPNYTETRQVWVNGEHIASRDQIKLLSAVDQCYYHGFTAAATTPATEFATLSADAVPLEARFVALDTCSGGLSGVFYHNGALHSIRPALEHLSADDIDGALPKMFSTHARRAAFSATARSFDLQAAVSTRPRGLHVVYRIQDTSFVQSGTCGIDKVNIGGFAPASAAINASASAGHGAHGHEHSHDHDHGETSGDDAADSFIAHVLSDLRASAAAAAAGTADGMAAQALTEIWVETLFANDHARYLQTGESTEQSSAALANTVSSLYAASGFAPKINVVLTAQVTFANSDPWTVTLGACTGCSASEVSVSDLLSKWNQWRSSPSKAPAHDNGHLLSGHDFETSVLGYAGVGTMCNVGASGGIDQTRGLEPAMAAAVIAHEMGHNLGCQHDSQGNSCPASGFIMNAIINTNAPPTQFSTCSRDYVAQTVTPSMTCVQNTPISQWSDVPVCGNGLVEDGEQCDCGQADCSSLDPCCNGSTCSFLPGATCSNTQPCCESCGVVPASSNKLCRAALDSCDLAEYCDGAAASCPADSFVGAGHDCHTAAYGAGVCYGGSCKSHVRQCREDTKTYTGGPYNQCPAKLQRNYNDGNFCGVMYCQSSSMGSSCGYFTSSAVVIDIEDGVPCGDGLQCLNGACRSSAELTPDFEFVFGEWSECSACDQQQTRTIGCRRVSDQEVVVAAMCGVSSSLSSRLCVNEELGCTGKASSDDGVDFFGHTLPKYGVVLIIIGMILFVIGLFAVCTYCTTRGRYSPEAQAELLKSVAAPAST